MHLRSELFEFLDVAFSRTTLRIQTFKPLAIVKHAFLRIPAQMLFGNRRVAILVGAFEQSHLVKERNQTPVFSRGDRNVVRAPWVRDQITRPAVSCSTGVLLKFQENEVRFTRAIKPPCCGKPCHATPDNDDLVPSSIGHAREIDPITQTMPDLKVWRKEFSLRWQTTRLTPQ